MSSSLSILVVEDQSGEREAMSRLLRSEGYRAITASDQRQAQKSLGDPIDLVICDLRLGQDSGMEVLQEWREKRPMVPVILTTAYGDVNSAVAAMKMGASDYLTKPLKPDELLLLLNRYLPMRNRSPEQIPIDVAGIGQMIGQSQAMRVVFEQIRKVSESDSIVLITGESGTGKELVASAIHDHSRRRQNPLSRSMFLHSLNHSLNPNCLVMFEVLSRVPPRIE